MMGRLLLLIRETFVPYPANHGLSPGRATATKLLCDLSSHPRPLNTPLRNGAKGNSIQVSGRRA